MSIYSAAIVADGAALYWRLNEAASAATAADSSTGGTKSGTYRFTVAADYAAAGLSGDGDKAVLFHPGTGTDDPFVDIPRATYAVNTAAFSVEVATNLSTGYATNDVIYIAGDDTNGQFGGWRIFWDTTVAAGAGCQLNFTMGFATFQDLALGLSTSIDPKLTWHIVATYNGNDMNLYLNGVAQTGAVGDGAMTVGTKLTTVGKDPGSTFKHLYGTIDDFAIYPSALTATQVTTHYALFIGQGYRTGFPRRAQGLYRR